MDKKILRNFAINARQIMENDTRAMLGQFGITDKEIVAPSPKSEGTMLLFDIGRDEPNIVVGKRIHQYNKLLSEIERRSFEKDYSKAINQLIEEVSYTWFNRIIAIRFMEVNSFLADNIRILSSAKDGINEPDIVSNFEYSTLDIGDDEKKVLIEKRYGQAKDLEELFQELFIKTCNKLNESLPDLFEKTDDYAELLLNISYSDPNGVIRKLIYEVPEEYFDISKNGQVEIIGWIYQYYQEAEKERVVKLGKSVDKNDLPAATQIFTTDWVVKYMVENSLGKYWIERNPDSKLREKLEFLIPNDIETVNEYISPEDIKFLDNTMGSGHILVYAFDLLMEIYTERGYIPSEAARLIVEKNLFGLEIDKRAYQLAYFAIMMKARSYDKRVLSKNISNNLYYFEDSDDILNYQFKNEVFEGYGKNLEPIEKAHAEEQVKYLINKFENAEELGSIMQIDGFDFDLINRYLNDVDTQNLTLWSQYNQPIENRIKNIVAIAKIISDKYHIVVTNPPYLNRMGPGLKKYVKNHYKKYGADLFSIFIYNNINMLEPGGYASFMTPNVWMFISTYENLRKYIIYNEHIDSLVQIAKGSFYSEATVDVMTVTIKNQISSSPGSYIRLEGNKGDMDYQAKLYLKSIKDNQSDLMYEAYQNNFKKIPGTPIAYWASDSIIKDFEKSLPMNEFLEPKVGLQTGDNSRFLRLWWEVFYGKIKFDTKGREEAINSNAKWFPYNKGGNRRKWYGNYDYVINWEDDGKEIRNFTDDKGKQRSVIRNPNYYFCPSVTWSDITSGRFSARYREIGSIHDVSGMSAFGSEDSLKYSLGILNTKVTQSIFNLLNPTIHLQIGNFSNFPVLLMDDKEKEKDVINITVDNIDISKAEWNSYETAWDFTNSPLLKFNNPSIEQSLELLIKERETMIEGVRKNEEDLNVIFTDLYNLNDEIDTHVTREEITLRDVIRESAIKDFISYAVGCMFGRYSLDKEGLVLAGGEIDYSNYKTYTPDHDNVIIICEDHVKDDIVEKFQEFVRVAFGDENFEENIDFIADSLGGKGTSLDKIRNYFIKDLFKDHAKNYSVIGSGRRPIYWLYDSGKQNAFKALIYMHRYDKDTTGRVRVDYLHKVQRMYEERLDQNQSMIEILDSARDKTRLEKENEVYRKKLDEIRDYDKKIAVLADMRIDIDLDDGVKVNHQKIQIDKDGNNLQILAKI